MTCHDLIKILEECCPDSKVTVWNTALDCEWDEVRVSRSNNVIHIGSTAFGTELRAADQSKASHD
jgi:hypothetical protein